MASNAAFHADKFDGATLTKLKIYQEYLENWLPVFIQQPNSNWTFNINIFDFFCGPGTDGIGQGGSPLVALKVCLKFEAMLADKGRTVTLHFSDDNSENIKLLEKQLETFNLPNNIKYTIDCRDFSDALSLYSPRMKNSANLLFMDQFGIRHVGKTTFQKLISLPKTDILFFISSSHLLRFAQKDEFKKHLDFHKYINSLTKSTDVHRAVVKMYKEMIPSSIEYYLAPFTLKKQANPNIYGLIFGSSNLIGLLKFLKVTWSLDIVNGESNFDLDDDRLATTTGQPDFFKDDEKSTKVQSYQKDLEELILAGDLSTDREVFKYSLMCGFLPIKHSKEVMVRLQKQGKIYVSGGIRLSESCLKEPRTIETTQS